MYIPKQKSNKDNRIHRLSIQLNKMQNQSHRFKSLLNQFREKKDAGKIIMGINKNRYVSEEKHYNSITYEKGMGCKTKRTSNNKSNINKIISNMQNNNKKFNGKITQNSDVQYCDFSFVYNCYDSTYQIAKNPQSNILSKQQNKIQTTNQQNNINGFSVRRHLRKQRKKYLNPQDNVVQIQGKSLLRYLLSYQYYINHQSQSKLIYDFFISLSLYYGIDNKKFIIKRYSNSIYYGQKGQDIYNGFLWNDNQVMYYGMFIRGKKHQNGIQVYVKEKQVWKGQYFYGKKQGFFQIFTPQYNYFGNVNNGYFQGQGSLTTQKSTYKGNFHSGLKNGYGQQIFHNDNINYKGYYYENKFQGKGQISKKNYFYKGYFKANRPQGQGYERTDQFEYFGQFVKGKKEGRGIIKLKNVDSYEGIFKDGKLVNQKYKQQEPMKFRIKVKKNEKQIKNINFKNVIVQNRQQQYLKVFQEEQTQNQNDRSIESKPKHEYQQFYKSYKKKQFLNVSNSDDEELPLQTKIV